LLSETRSLTGFDGSSDTMIRSLWPEPLTVSTPPVDIATERRSRRSHGSKIGGNAFDLRGSGVSCCGWFMIFSGDVQAANDRDDTASCLRHAITTQCRH